jgi:hypothetical protein
VKQQGGITGKGFVKGDPRINRKGRPKSFDAFRALAQQIAHEATDRVESGHKVTIAEKILRDWAMSRNPILQRAFVEVAFGKVPDNINLNADTLRLLVEYVNNPYPAPDVSPSTSGDPSGIEEV